MTSIIAIFITIVIILNKFQTQPTITGVDVITEHIDIEFPQIFICFDWIHLNHSHILEVNAFFRYNFILFEYILILHLYHYIYTLIFNIFMYTCICIYIYRMKCMYTKNYTIGILENILI